MGQLEILIYFSYSAVPLLSLSDFNLTLENETTGP